MDQVLFLIKGHEIYIGEYYKNTIKKVVFKEKDFWEVFDQHDFMEMIDYMNYPMNYKKFKDNKIYILYDTPKKYEMLCQIQQVFNQAEGVEVGQLALYLIKTYRAKCAENDGLEDRAYLLYEQTYYKIERVMNETQEIITLKQQNEWEIEGLENLEETERVEQLQKCVCTITTEEICRVMFEDQSEVISLESYYPILAPVNLYKTKQDKGKKKFLETYFVLNENLLDTKKAYLQKEVILFSYDKIVNKLFGKQQQQILSKKAPKEGIYYHCLEEKEQDLWAKKDQLVGVITQEHDRKKVIHWLEQSGFGGTISEEVVD